MTQAETQPAWAYRAKRWTTSSAAAPAEGCPIKGNISAEGERICHTPWSPFVSPRGIAGRWVQFSDNPEIGSRSSNLWPGKYLARRMSAVRA